MAKGNNVTKQLLKRVDNLKTTAQKVNTGIIETSDNIVDETLATGKEWQKIFAKALQNGTVLFGKQQDLFIDTVATVKKQYDTGSVRFMNLLGIKDAVDFTFSKAKSTMEAAVAEVKAIQAGPSKTTKKVKKAAKKTLKNAIAEVENIKDEVLKSAPAKSAKKITKSAKKVTKKAKKATKKVTAKAKATATPKITKTVKAVKKATPVKKAIKAAAPAKKAAKKVVKKTTTIATKDDLTQINGIGPKIARIFNGAGIYTFKLFAATDLKTLNNILENAGTRYSKFDPKPWRVEAKQLAKK